MCSVQSPIPPGVPSLAEILKQRGYHTFAVSASPIVRNTPSNPKYDKRQGYGRGFDVFHEDCLWKHADCVNAAAFQILEERPAGPFFSPAHEISRGDSPRPV